MDKALSRKLIVTIISVLLIAANRKLGLGLNETDVAALAGLVATYLASQGYVDGKKKSK